ncbi:Permease of the drug/metabolite transporter (DMT) superfamily [Paenibacillus sp. 1_12]|uniref:DMT family transporter n=1 Tax=Paenibacillus sp. 1_12 TaxID=1566278 RepID=UPI0008E11663|nr:DMT family transporter [Paenibacillus sp. 1_12]SFL80844.1 Permease of the drug/metabolite transporter (DMT) superfamily [Paenibacillus sp. 1_12]
MNWRSPYVLLVLATCLWGGNFVVGKVLVADIPPILLATLRWCIALIVITPIYGKDAWTHRALFFEKWKMLTFLSLTGVAGFNTLVYMAVQYTSSINAAVMNAATPILIIMVSWVMLRESISLKTIPGIGLSMLGVLWMITRGSWDVLVNLSFNQGDLWMLAAILCWALYSVGMRRSAKQVPAHALFVYTIIISVALLIPLSIVEVMLVKPVLHISLGMGSGIVYIGVFASLIAFSAWNQSIAMIGPARCAGFLNLIPLFSTIFATAFTGERIHIYHFAGAALILTGIYAANRMLKLNSPTP